MRINDIKKWAVTIGWVLTILSLVFTGYQIMQTNKQLELQKQLMKWQNYNLLNERYSRHMLSIPISLSENNGTFSDLTIKEKIWVRIYLDLTSEEYWLYINNLLPENMWKIRISKGLIHNFAEIPMLLDGFKYYKNNGTLYFSANFISEIEKLINKLSTHE